MREEGLYGHGDGMRSAVSKMDREISIRSEKGRIQNVDLASIGGNRLGSSKTKVIPTSQSQFLMGKPWNIVHYGRPY